MIVYVGKYNLKIEWTFIDNELKKEYEKHWIISILPVFDNEDKAIEFCWKWGYILMAQWS